MSRLIFSVALLIACAHASTSECDVTYGNSCFKLSEEVAYYLEALSMCRTVGARLAEVHDDQVRLKLVQFLRDSHVLVTWLGATDAQNEGEWVWTYSNTPVTYANWKSSQPMNDTEDQDYLIMDNGFFVAIQGDPDLPYFCETSLPSGSTKDMEPECVFANKDKCVWFVETTQNFRDAIEDCNVANGRLVEAHDDALRIRLYQYALDKNPDGLRGVWVGGSDRTHEGTFRWAGSGDAMQHTGWQCKQPDNRRNSQNCMVIAFRFHGKFDDFHCNTPLRYFCERPVSESTTGDSSGAITTGGSSGAITTGGSSGAITTGGSSGAIARGGSSGAITTEASSGESATESSADSSL